MEDYSNFSWESIQKSLRDIIAEVKEETGASDDQITLALSECAERIMNTNGFMEPKRQS
jgi:hypothetical protein